MKVMCARVFVGAQKSSKQSTLKFKPAATKPKKSESVDEELDDDSYGAEKETEAAVVPRERVERKAKGEFRSFSAKPRQVFVAPGVGKPVDWWATVGCEI